MTQGASGRSSGRVLYVQHTNPAAYPPIEHSALLLAEAGYHVSLLGLGHLGDALQFRGHPNIHVELMRPGSGRIGVRLRYLQYTAWVAWRALRWAPDWLYVSDAIACPAALVAASVSRARIVYHEHDSPVAEGAARQGWFARRVRTARRRIAQRAALCILPNARRARAFASETGRADPLCIWNCPTADEVAPPRDGADGSTAMRVLYHGSIVPARLPVTVVEAIAQLPPAVSLVFAGYETAGHPGYVEQLLQRARDLRVADRVRYTGVIPSRAELMQQCATCDVGLAMLVPGDGDPNEQAMAGASNKPFDYLACGLALVVTDLPDWREMFVEPGFSVTADPLSAASIAGALRWMLEHPAERRAMAERGRQQIATAWNYDRLFAPVLEVMASSASTRSSAPAPQAAARS